MSAEERTVPMIDWPNSASIRECILTRITAEQSGAPPEGNWTSQSAWYTPEPPSSVCHTGFRNPPV